jgi:hypothetical protein
MSTTVQQSASRRYLTTFTALMWLAVPAMAGLYAMAWPKLPAHLATHFDFANHPNGWMSREASLVFSLMLGIFFVGLATLILSRVKNPDPAAWALLVFFYVIIATLLWAEHRVIAFNVHREPLNVAPVLFAGVSAAILVVIIALGTRRGVQLPASNVMAVERHGSAMLASVLGAAAVAMTAALSAIPVAGARVALGFGVVLMLAGAAVAWDGFRYVFSPAGIEIRTLGFRLRSIPAADIQNYAVDRWNILGGYGIRGVGTKRAYVWGNRGVRIDTFEGEVFLGHDEPEKIVHDLDRITGNHEARASHGS